MSTLKALWKDAFAYPPSFASVKARLTLLVIWTFVVLVITLIVLKVLAL